MKFSNLFLLFLLFLFSCHTDTSDSVWGTVQGETLAFDGEEWNTLYKENIRELRLYRIEPDRNVTTFVEGRDYRVENNKIRRTHNSRIPDFKNHVVIYNSQGKFKWTPEPDRNPELSISYQVYADYKFFASQDMKLYPSRCFSPGLQANLEAGKKVKIASVGTSVTFGSHTYEWFFHDSDKQTYPYLVAKALNKLYGVESSIKNLSIDGGGVEQLRDLDPIIAFAPDLVFIELGMNDHNGPSPDRENYCQAIQTAVSKFQLHDIDVILVGFFQQNRDWEVEYPENTLTFNATLREIANEYNLYFADIYSAFSNLEPNKLYRDYTGDYMHHPTSFGHQLYYKEIMPYFLPAGGNEVQLLNYIY